jgi:hypothetical protein
MQRRGDDGDDNYDRVDIRHDDALNVDIGVHTTQLGPTRRYGHDPPMVAVILNRHEVTHGQRRLLVLFNMLSQKAIKSLPIDLDTGPPLGNRNDPSWVSHGFQGGHLRLRKENFQHDLLDRQRLSKRTRPLLEIIVNLSDSSLALPALGACLARFSDLRAFFCSFNLSLVSSARNTASNSWRFFVSNS